MRCEIFRCNLISNLKLLHAADIRPFRAMLGSNAMASMRTPSTGKGHANPAPSGQNAKEVVDIHAAAVVHLQGHDLHVPVNPNDLTFHTRRNEDEGNRVKGRCPDGFEKKREIERERDRDSDRETERERERERRMETWR